MDNPNSQQDKGEVKDVTLAELKELMGNLSDDEKLEVAWDGRDS